MLGIQSLAEQCAEQSSSRLLTMSSTVFIIRCLQSVTLFFFFFLVLMYKLQSTEDSSTWLVVRIRSAEDGHSSIQQGAGNQRSYVVKQQVQIKTY